MVDKALPFDTGGAVTEAEWAIIAPAWARSGVLAKRDPNNGNVDPVPAALTLVSGMTVSLAPANYWVNGFAGFVGSARPFTLATANPTLPRNDIIVARLDRAAKTILPVLVTGSPAANPLDPTLLATDTVYDLALWRINVRANVGTIDMVQDVDDLRVSAYPPPELLTYGPTLPGAYPTGSRFYQSNEHLSYLYSGTEWCIEPGQLLAQKSFLDTAATSYSTPSRIGARNTGGANGPSDAYINWTPPPLLFGHGVAIGLRCRFLTANATPGDLISVNVTIYKPNGEFAPFAHQYRNVDGRFAAQYNPTFDGDWYLYRDDPGLARVPVTWAVDGFLPTGIVQFYDGQFTIRSV